MFFKFASLVIGQPYDCPSGNEVSMEDIAKIEQYYSTTKHSKVQNVSLYLEMYFT